MLWKWRLVWPTVRICRSFLLWGCVWGGSHLSRLRGPVNLWRCWVLFGTLPTRSEDRDSAEIMREFVDTLFDLVLNSCCSRALTSALRCFGNVISRIGRMNRASLKDTPLLAALIGSWSLRSTRELDGFNRLGARLCCSCQRGRAPCSSIRHVESVEGNWM